MSEEAERRRELVGVVAAAQRVAGLVAARGRGDSEGARRLLRSFESTQDLAGGAMLVAELSLGLLARDLGEDLEAAVRDLCLEMEATLG